MPQKHGSQSYEKDVGAVDLVTRNELHSLVTTNGEDCISFNTNIGGTNQYYEYGKDSFGRLFDTQYVLVDLTNVGKTTGYGGYGQQTSSTLVINGTTRLTTNYTFKTVNGIDFSGLVENESIQQGGATTQYLYTYDVNNNITKIRKTEGGITTNLYRYVYDEAGQLIREDNTVSSRTTTWQYDVGGSSAYRQASRSRRSLRVL